MLADELALALNPLHEAFESPGALRDFLEDLGWDFDAAPAAIERLRTPVEQVFAILSEPDGVDAGDVARILTSVRAVLNAVSGLAAEAELAIEFKNEFPRQLVDYLVVNYLLKNQPRVGYVLMGLGIISVEDRPETNTRPPYVFFGFAWERLPDLLHDPKSHLTSVYRWRQSTFDSVRLIDSLAGFLEAWNQQISTDAVDAPTAANLNKNAVQPDAITDAVLRLILFEDAIDAALANAGAGLFLLPETASAKPGFAMLPFAAGNLTQDVPLSDELSIGVRGNVDLAGGAGVLVRPGRDVEFLLGLASGTPAPASGTFAFALRYARAGGRFVPIGSADESRFELAALSTTVGTRLSSSGIDAFAEFALEQSKVAIKPDSETLDGFLADVLPAKGIEFDTSVTVGLSSNRGVYFTGTGGDSLQSALDAKADLDATLPVNIPAGPITLRAVHLRLAAGNTGIKAEISTSLQTTFGPVSAVIERLGLLLDVDYPRGGSTPAPLDARGGFKPPSGVGLSVDVTGVVSGGGFLFHDPVQGLYAGAMQLSLREQMTLKAFGLISTRMPDGSRGYSLIVFITAEDFRPIPLGLGFTLLGIGGIVGVNRTFDERVLRAGLSSGALATLLFPRDPIGNAGTLIRNLSSAFPPLRGSYLLGLMAKIGWFTPTLVLMDLALILEFGARTRLLALGRISALLPSPDNDLVRLQMEAIGVIDFDAGTAAIDAELVDSRLAKKFPITGNAALRAGFGQGPGFVLAVGGFNPHFAAPTTVPSLKRVAIALSSGTNPRLVCEAYFAITSNTVQFGAEASLYASAAGFSVEGNVGFDVLVQLAPLHFLAEFHAKLQLKRGSHNLFGVQVNGAIEGPRPLRISGKAKFEIFWCDFTVRFDATLVKGERPPLPAAVNVFDQLKQALQSATSWSTQRSATETHGVALRSLPTGTATAPIVLDPLGRLVVKQQVVPLNTGSDIEIFGSAPVSGDRRFTLTATLDGSSTQLPSAPVQASFAPAQFFVMSDDEKLAAPSFQSMEAGSMFGEAGVTFDATQIIPAPLEYHVISITLDGPAPPTDTTPPPPAFAMDVEQLRVFARSGAAARAPVRRVGRARFRNDSAEPAATLEPNRWTIQPIGEGAAPPVEARVKTYVEYQAVVNVMNRAGARWQVVPASEVETRNSDAG